MKQALCLAILSSYCLAFVTEAFFSDRDLCLWQNKFYDRNFFSLTETFIILIQPNYVSLTEILTETCFCDENMYPEEIFLFDRNLFLCQT